MGGPKGGGELRWRRVAEAGAAGGGTKAIAGVGFVGAEGVLAHPFPCGLSPRAAFGEKLGYFTKRCRFNKWRFPVSILPAGEGRDQDPAVRLSPSSPATWSPTAPGSYFDVPHPPFPLYLGVSAPCRAPFPLCSPHASELAINPKCNHPSHPCVLER